MLYSRYSRWRPQAPRSAGGGEKRKPLPGSLQATECPEGPVFRAGNPPANGTGCGTKNANGPPSDRGAFLLPSRCSCRPSGLPRPASGCRTDVGATFRSPAGARLPQILAVEDLRDVLAQLREGADAPEAQRLVEAHGDVVRLLRRAEPESAAVLPEPLFDVLVQPAANAAPLVLRLHAHGHTQRYVVPEAVPADVAHDTVPVDLRHRDPALGDSAEEQPVWVTRPAEQPIQRLQRGGVGGAGRTDAGHQPP